MKIIIKVKVVVTNWCVCDHVNLWRTYNAGKRFGEHQQQQQHNSNVFKKKFSEREKANRMGAKL